jgi:hypothetical protein
MDLGANIEANAQRQIETFLDVPSKNINREMVNTCEILEWAVTG